MGKWLQSTEHLRFEVHERVARITLHRPDRRNALSAFDADVAALGFKAAVRKRDAPFGDGVARPSW